MRSGRRPQRKKSPTSIIKNTLNEIPPEKMEEILDHEHRDLIVFEIREEIMSTVMEKCYEIYLDKQTVLFTGYCAYLAWKHLFQWAFFPRDPGEPAYEKSEKWLPDKPPEPSVRDTWAGYAMPIIPKPEQEDKMASVHETDFRNPCESYKESVDRSLKEPSVLEEEIVTESKKVPSDKATFVQEKKFSRRSTSLVKHEDSMFTKTKTMRFESLPEPLPSGLTEQKAASVINQTTLIDDKVEAARKVPIQTSVRLRVPATITILDKDDPCYDLGKKEKKCKMINTDEIEKFNKKPCPSEKISTKIMSQTDEMPFFEEK